MCRSAKGRPTADVNPNPNRNPTNLKHLYISTLPVTSTDYIRR